MALSIRSSPSAPLGDDFAVSQLGDSGRCDEQLVPEQRCDVTIERRRMMTERCAEDASIDQQPTSRGNSSGEGVGLLVSQILDEELVKRSKDRRSIELNGREVARKQVGSVWRLRSLVGLVAHERNVLRPS
jgi:hypothetical protein